MFHGDKPHPRSINPSWSPDTGQLGWTNDKCSIFPSCSPSPSLPVTSPHRWVSYSYPSLRDECKLLFPAPSEPHATPFSEPWQKVSQRQVCVHTLSCELSIFPVRRQGHVSLPPSPKGLAEHFPVTHPHPSGRCGLRVPGRPHSRRQRAPTHAGKASPQGRTERNSGACCFEVLVGQKSVSGSSD